MLDIETICTNWGYESMQETSHEMSRPRERTRKLCALLRKVRAPIGPVTLVYILGGPSRAETLTSYKIYIYAGDMGECGGS
jgi:hypothetical protein